MGGRLVGVPRLFSARKVLLQVVRHELEDVLWLGDVLEPVPSQVLQLYAHRPTSPRSCAVAAGHHDLAAMRAMRPCRAARCTSMPT